MIPAMLLKMPQACTWHRCCGSQANDGHSMPAFISRRTDQVGQGSCVRAHCVFKVDPENSGLADHAQ